MLARERIDRCLDGPTGHVGKTFPLAPPFRCVGGETVVEVRRCVRCDVMLCLVVEPPREVNRG